MTTQTVIDKTVKVGKWEVQVGGLPPHILRVRSQGSKSWLRYDANDIRWRNAINDIIGQKPDMKSLVLTTP